jgi:hypothetical protein
LHEARVSLGKGDGDTSRYHGTLAGSELHALAGGQVETRITGVGSARDNRLRPEARDLEPDHLRRADEMAASATR